MITTKPQFTAIRALTTALVLTIAIHILLVIVAGAFDVENSKGNGFSEIANSAFTVVFFMGGFIGNRFFPGHPNWTSILIVVGLSVLLDTVVLWITVLLLMKIIRLRRAATN